MCIATFVLRICIGTYHLINYFLNVKITIYWFFTISKFMLICKEPANGIVCVCARARVQNTERLHDSQWKVCILVVTNLKAWDCYQRGPVQALVYKNTVVYILCQVPIHEQTYWYFHETSANHTDFTVLRIYIPFQLEAAWGDVREG